MSHFLPEFLGFCQLCDIDSVSGSRGGVVDLPEVGTSAYGAGYSVSRDGASFSRGMAFLSNGNSAGLETILYVFLGQCFHERHLENTVKISFVWLFCWIFRHIIKYNHTSPLY